MKMIGRAPAVEMLISHLEQLAICVIAPNLDPQIIML